MSFRATVRTVYLRKCLTFSTRAARQEFWVGLFAFAIVLAGALVSLGILGARVGVPHDSLLEPAKPPLSLLIASLILLFLVLLMIVPVIAVSVRRLHDRGHSGWWFPIAIVLTLVPYVGWLGLFYFVYQAALPGTDGANKYGADPLRGVFDPDVFA